MILVSISMRKLILFSFFILVFTASSACLPVFGMGLSRKTSFVPKPRLLYPDTDEVDLAGKNHLEFSWSPHEGLSSSARRYYDLRLYKGYDMVASNLIFKEKIYGNRDSATVSSDLFENGRIYTWSLRQGYKGTGKSVRSFQSFKAIK